MSIKIKIINSGEEIKINKHTQVIKKLKKIKHLLFNIDEFLKILNSSKFRWNLFDIFPKNDWFIFTFYFVYFLYKIYKIHVYLKKKE